jgi:phage gp46-like protein
MIDVKIIRNSSTNEFDIEISEGDLLAEDGLETAILISIFTDQRVDGERGCWIDAIDGDNWGSKVWTLMREKLTEETRTKFNSYIKDSLKWLTEDRVAKSITVTSEIVPPESIYTLVEIIRPDGSATGFRFNTIWGEQQN